MTAGELAALLKLPLRGDPARRLEGAAVLEQAERSHLAFVGAAKYFAGGLRSGAGCLIAPPEYLGTEQQTILASSQPRAHFAKALSILYP